MHFNHTNIILCVMFSFLLISCGPKKEEDKSPTQKQVERQAETPRDAHSTSGEKTDTPLTPEEKEQLEINEDTVMNPLPG